MPYGLNSSDMKNERRFNAAFVIAYTSVPSCVRPPFGVNPAALFPQALGRDLGDRIQVWKRPPGVTAYSKDLFVWGITHTFSPTWWQTVWTTQSASRYSFFVLDNATLGQLDHNALAF